MEFVLFLDKIEIEIIRLVEQAGYSIEENTNLCFLGGNYVGFLKKKQKKIVICTNNVKEKERYKMKRIRNNDNFERTAIHLKKALRHEAAHIAQECNNGKMIDINKNLKINPAKLNALKGSTMVSGERQKEKQAYILEDKPKLILENLRKYCL